MPSLSPTTLADHRAHIFRTTPQRRLDTVEQAADFVHERGFIFFWPVKDAPFPSLWAAVAGDRPVPDAHDDPGHITWRWKDQSLGQRRWHYAKLFRGKATLVALADLPYLYALSENFGEPELDYLDQYHDGHLTVTAKAIYEYLLQNGPIDTVTLRKELRLTTRSADSAFNKALTDLQRDFKIMPVGVAETGSWRYSFRYQCVHTYYPDLVAQAAAITRRAAQSHLLRRYAVALGAFTLADARRFFQWPPRDLTATLTDLVTTGDLIADATLPDQPTPHYALPTLTAP